MAVAGYNIYLGGVKKNTSLVTDLNYALSGLTPETTYSVTVSAVDHAGNESPQSAAVNFTTTAAPATGYEAEYQNWLNYINSNGFTEPTIEQQEIDNLKIKHLKDIGAYNQLDTIMIGNSNYTPESWAKNAYRVDFKNPGSFTLYNTAGLEPSFTSGQGFNVVGGSGKYARTGFIPAQHAGNMTGDNMSEIFSLFNVPATYTAATYFAGGRTGNTMSQVLFGINNPNSMLLRFGTTTGSYTLDHSLMNSHFHVYKNKVNIEGTITNVCKVFRNGSEEVAGTVGTISNILENTEQWLLGVNNSENLLGSNMNIGIKYYLRGAALDTLKMEIYQIMNEIYIP
ncbi:fibronectin type III domain-containing protein [Salinimicrobium sp. 3283s]|uniref:fibronectin type III domain-containing protein n=1 Tax=Salinimicrobium sp. 3283s TaxID=3114359 RepID=UPI0031E5B6C6